MSDAVRYYDITDVSPEKNKTTTFSTFPMETHTNKVHTSLRFGDKTKFSQIFFLKLN